MTSPIASFPRRRPHPITHGTRSRYEAGCKCPPCAEAGRRYEREKKRRRARRRREQRLPLDARACA